MWYGYSAIGHEDMKLGRFVVGTLMQAEFKDECGTGTRPLAMKT